MTPYDQIDRAISLGLPFEAARMARELFTYMAPLDPRAVARVGLAMYHSGNTDLGINMTAQALALAGGDIDHIDYSFLACMYLAAGHTGLGVGELIGAGSPAAPMFSAFANLMRQPLNLPPASKPRTLLSLPLWGPEYVENFLRFAAPSYCASGNLPALAQVSQPTWLIYTTQRDAEAMNEDPAIIKLRECGDVFFLPLPPGLLVNDKYLVTAGIAQISLVNAKAHGADLFFVFPDAIIADGGFRFIASIRDSHDAMVCQGVGMPYHGAADVLDAHRSEGVLSLLSHDLVALLDALPPGDPSFWSEFRDDGSVRLRDHPGAMIFRTRHGLQLRALQPLPLWLSHRALGERPCHWSTPDNGLFTRLFPDPGQWGRVRFVESSDEFGFFGLQRGSDTGGAVEYPTERAAIAGTLERIFRDGLIDRTRVRALVDHPLRLAGSRGDRSGRADAFLERMTERLADLGERRMAHLFRLM